MPLPVLVTQCLQRDFVGPLAPHQPLPNRLHIGHREAERLLGHDPANGPVAQLMRWARAQGPERLAVVHIRDWHDPDDPRQKEHLERFGLHCLMGTEGAELVFDAGGGARARDGEDLVDSIALNDFEHTCLDEVLEELKRRSPDGALRVAVVGVWTEAKVSFLLYDLKTRAGVEHLATSSALTASHARSQHFNALEQLRKILGVEVFPGVGALCDWLVPDGAEGDAPGSGLHTPVPAHRPRFVGPPLDAESEALLACLYRDAARAELTPLSGGFSGASVFKVSSWDALGHEQAPSVAKLGPRDLIGKERVTFERIEDILGNDAPAVRAFVDLGARAGLKYSYASMGRGEVTTFKSLYEKGAPGEEVEHVLDTVYRDILGRFYRAATYERCPLLQRYGFRPGMGPRVRALVAGVVGEDAARRPRIALGGREVPNVATFYEGFLEEGPAPEGEHRFVSYVHGDLNGANILLDARGNVWVIDFFHAARDHVLKDLAKLENDLLYILTPIADEETLGQAMAMTRALASVQDLAAPLGACPPEVTAAPLRRAWDTLGVLRGIGGALVHADRDPLQLHVALLRYAVHTLSFDESDGLQKRWALYAACLLAASIEDEMRGDRDLRIAWVDVPGLPEGAGRLGVTICPGRKDKGRAIADDLAALRAEGASTLVSLITEEELEWLGVADLEPRARDAGLGYRFVRVPDQAAPALADATEEVDRTLADLTAGRSVVLHCKGGLGRSGTVAACVLAARGLAADDAIARVRISRGPRAVESRAQERFVERFAGLRA